MANVTITPANVLQSSAATPQNGGLIAQFVAAQTTTAGQVVFLNSSLKWEFATASDGTHGGAVGAVVGISANGCATDQPLTVCVLDANFVVGGTLAAGTAYFASTTAGAIMPESDLAGGDYRIFLGVAVSTTVLTLKPTTTGTTA